MFQKSILILFIIFIKFGHSSSSIIGNNVQNKIQRSFKIDYENNVFLKDGRPFRYISGEIHYFRIHPSLWEKRLRQVRAAGLNAIQFYIPWNFHETKPNSFNFDGDRDVVRFLRLAQQNELDVLLRIGPYICSEWEFGGLPWWLISKGRNGTVGQIRIRTSDERYLHYVARYFSILLPMLKPWLHKNGGPILMLQIENEYGHVPSLCDHSYMRWLRDTVWAHLGEYVVLYTTDGFYTEQMGICGTIEGVFPTIDFGIDQTEEMIKANFVKQKKHSAGKASIPNFGQCGCRCGANPVFYANKLAQFWRQWTQCGPRMHHFHFSCKYGQNLSKYNSGKFFNGRFHGGTNFGFWSGRGLYFGKPGMVITSYDFGAAINEVGQTTPLYEAIRHWIQNLGPKWPNPPLEIPPNPRGIGVDPIEAIRLPNFIKTLNASSTFMPNDRCQISERIPLNFEQLEGPFQFVLYSTELDIGGTQLTIPHFRDMAYIFLDGKYQGTILENNVGLAISARMGQRLDILVESTGRRTYPLAEIDPKGILSVVLLNGKPAGQRWLQCGIDMDAMYENSIEQFHQQEIATSTDYVENVAGQISNGPLAIYVAKFSTLKGIDWANGHTFFDSCGWGRGVAFFNGFNIGRYWPLAGPQTSLFIPGALMKRENEWNFMVLLELDDVEDNEGKKNKQIHFLAEPIVKYSDKPFPPVD